MNASAAIARPAVAFDERFYRDLDERRNGFGLVSTHVIPGGTGYGVRVDAGQTFRFVVMEGAAGLDIGVQGVGGPSEWFSLGTQVTVEGLVITPGTRLWSVPPRSRPLCTMLRDTYWERERPDGRPLAIACGGHCNPHEWMDFNGTHPRTCEDNLRAAGAMLGLSQRDLSENINGGWQMCIDTETGYESWEQPAVRPGDLLEFYAETALHVMTSLCPSGTAEATEGDLPEGELFPIRFEVHDTGVAPLPWAS